MQHTANSPSPAAEASTAAVQQVQPPTKFEISAFEGDRAVSWLKWSQRVVYQTRACSFEAELTVAEGEGLSVGADLFDGSNVDPARLRNARVAWMTLINNCRGMSLGILQRSETPNDAWRNLESLYRVKGTREILCLSHEANGKTMQPGEDLCQFMMELNRLAADLHRLGGRSIAELR